MWTTLCVINTIDTAVCVACLSPFLIGITGSKKMIKREDGGEEGGEEEEEEFLVPRINYKYHKYCTFSVT